MTTDETRKELEIKADKARRRVASDVRELARSGEVLVNRSQAVARVAAPILVGVAVVGGLWLARRRSRSTADHHRFVGGYPPRRSVAAELLRRATISFVSVAVARWAQRTPLLGAPSAAHNDSSGDR